MNLPKTTLSWTYLKSLAPKIWSKSRQNNYSRLEFNKNDMKVGLYHQTHIEMATNFTADRLFGTKTFVDRARNRSQIFKSKKKNVLNTEGHESINLKKSKSRQNMKMRNWREKRWRWRWFTCNLHSCVFLGALISARRRPLVWNHRSLHKASLSLNISVSHRKINKWTPSLGGLN